MDEPIRCYAVDVADDRTEVLAEATMGDDDQVHVEVVVLEA